MRSCTRYERVSATSCYVHSKQQDGMPLYIVLQRHIFAGARVVQTLDFIRKTSRPTSPSYLSLDEPMVPYAAAANIDYYAVKFPLSSYETIDLHIGWKNNAWRRKWWRRSAGLTEVLAHPIVRERIQNGVKCLLIE